jgi:hypothetical protein|tara:strand:- start:382 stop:681 length:300 start_codon:yes stop_codon:yes gene_type:complete
MHQLQIFEAAFNFIGQILLEEYENNKQENTKHKIKCINQMHMYTHLLKVEHDILQQKYNQLQSETNKKIQSLENKLNEANDTIRFANLGSERFRKKNDR